MMEGENITLLWDFTGHYDRTIKADKPDIILKDFKKYKCYLLDMVIQSDKNISTKEFHKLSKCNDRELQIEIMRHLNITMIPIVIGALGMIEKNTDTHIMEIEGNPSLLEIQNIVQISIF